MMRDGWRSIVQSAWAAAENDDVKISSWKVCSIGMPDDGLDSWIFCILINVAMRKPKAERVKTSRPARRPDAS